MQEQGNVSLLAANGSVLSCAAGADRQSRATYAPTPEGTTFGRDTARGVSCSAETDASECIRARAFRETVRPQNAAQSLTLVPPVRPSPREWDAARTSPGRRGMDQERQDLSPERSHRLHMPLAL